MAKRRKQPAPTPPRPTGWRGAPAWILGILLIPALLLAAALGVADLLGGRLLRPTVESVSTRLAGRPVTMRELDLRLFSFNPSARVRGLVVGNPAAVSMSEPLARVGQVDVSVRLASLLHGTLRLPRLALVSPTLTLARDASGTANWSGSGEGGPPRLPPINHLVVGGGAFSYVDAKSRLNLKGTFGAEELRDGKGGFSAAGQGTANGSPFRFTVEGGALSKINEDTAFPVTLDVSSGASGIKASGRILHPFDLSTFEGELALKGDDLSNLYDLTGLALPNTPPYTIALALKGHGKRFDVTRLKGRLGHSDIAGTGSINLSGKKLYVKADLSTESLDFNDLNALLGAPPVTGGGDNQSEMQRQVAGRLRAEQRLLPDARLQVDRLANMDADVTYRAAKVSMPGVPLTSLGVTVALDDKVLTLQPLTLGFRQGEITGGVVLDASERVPDVKLDLRLSNLGLSTFFPDGGKNPPLSGTVLGRLRLHGQGFSVRQAASTADGQITLVIPHGEMRRAFAELMGINVVQGLGLLLANDKTATVLSCGVLDFHAKNGLLTAQTALLDTGPVLATGGGALDLGQEKLDLRLMGHPKQPSLVRLLVPVTIKGRLRAPQVSVDAAGGGAQTGTALALGVFLTPLAAILPFIDPGLAKDADCAALMARAASKGVPVGPAAR